MAFYTLARIPGECSAIHSPPALFLLQAEISSRTLIPLLGYDQSTVVQRAETSLAACSLRSCVWAHFQIGSHTMPGQRHSQLTLRFLLLMILYLASPHPSVYLFIYCLRENVSIIFHNCSVYMDKDPDWPCNGHYIRIILFFNNCTILLGFPLGEIRVTSPGESQMRQGRAIQPTVHAGCFIIYIIHRTLTYTTEF